LVKVKGLKLLIEGQAPKHADDFFGVRTRIDRCPGVKG
jgi:hypothetical protein